MVSTKYGVGFRQTLILDLTTGLLQYAVHGSYSWFENTAAEAVIIDTYHAHISLLLCMLN